MLASLFIGGTAFFSTGSGALQAEDRRDNKINALSERVIELARHFEGLHLSAYRCPAGKLTIGYGHTGDVREGDRLRDKRAAEVLLIQDMDVHRREVLNVLKGVPLTQSQLDALTSASYNCGCLKGGKSGFAGYLKNHLPLLNDEELPARQLERELHGIIAYLCRYNRANGRFMDGLLRRRLSEGLILAGSEDPIVSPEEYRSLKESAVAELPDPLAKKNEQLIAQMVRALLERRGVIAAL